MNKNNSDATVANLEAERQVLALLMVRNELFWKVAPYLKPEHFYLETHQNIYQLITHLLKTKQNANPITLKNHIHYQINREPAINYLLRLVKDPTSEINLDDYARIIVNLALRRKMIDAAKLVSQNAQTAEVTQNITTLLAVAETNFADIRAQIPGEFRDTTSISAVSDESLEHLAKLVSGEAIPYPTIGLPDVTRLIGPLAPGCVYVIAGRPGSGKTAAAVCAARAIIRQKKTDNTHFGVAYFTLEVTNRDLWNRFMACEMARSATPVNYMDLKRGNVTGNELTAVDRFTQKFKRFPLSLHDRSGLTIAQIYVEARAQQEKLKTQGLSLDVVVVDYLQIIKPMGRYAGNKVAEISDISMGLLALAKDLNVAVIAVSQLSRRVEERNDKRPILSDLRESGQIEQDANSIILLYRPAYYDAMQTEQASEEDLIKQEARRNDIYYIVAKARDGQPGEVINYTEIGKNLICAKNK